MTPANASPWPGRSRFCQWRRGELVDVHARGGRAGRDLLPNLICLGHLELDHGLERPRRRAAAVDVDQLVDAVRALVGQQGHQPSAHRVADEVGLVDLEDVHELAYVVDHVGERELLLEDVARAPVQAVDGQHAQAGIGEGSDVQHPVLGATRPTRAMDQDGRVAGASFPVAGLAVAHLGVLLGPDPRRGAHRGSSYEWLYITQRARPRQPPPRRPRPPCG